MEIRQNLSSEAAQEPFYNFLCAGLTASKDSRQGREEEYADWDRNGRKTQKTTLAKEWDIKWAVKSLSRSTFF